jgi:hypothetical protein
MAMGFWLFEKINDSFNTAINTYVKTGYRKLIYGLSFRGSNNKLS